MLEMFFLSLLLRDGLRMTTNLTVCLQNLVYACKAVPTVCHAWDRFEWQMGKGWMVAVLAVFRSAMLCLKARCKASFQALLYLQNVQKMHLCNLDWCCAEWRCICAMNNVRTSASLICSWHCIASCAHLCLHNSLLLAAHQCNPFLAAVHHTL